MKKGTVTGILLGLLLLGGCTEPVYEGVQDGIEAAAMAQAGQILLDIPAEFAAPAMENAEEGTLYLWKDFSLTLQTLEAGDLDRTLRACTGFGREELTVLQTRQDQMDRYVGAWTSAGEGTDQVGRIAVLDDGSYHYVLCLMAPEQEGEEQKAIWQSLMDSFQIHTVS